MELSNVPHKAFVSPSHFGHTYHRAHDESTAVRLARRTDFGGWGTAAQFPLDA